MIMQGLGLARTLAALTATALALAGCATVSGQGAGGQGAESPAGAVEDTIRFSAGPCFGFCPSYIVTVEPTGSAVLVPQRNTSVPGETSLTVTPAQYRRLRDAFAPFRPETGTHKRIGHGENCERVATDMPGYTIVWLRAGQKDTELDFYSGCFDDRYAALREAVRAVPAMLEIEAMLKPPRADAAD